MDVGEREVDRYGRRVPGEGEKIIRSLPRWHRAIRMPKVASHGAFSRVPSTSRRWKPPVDVRDVLKPGSKRSRGLHEARHRVVFGAVRK